jgi:two-component sensor histidine kinase
VNHRVKNNLASIISMLNMRRDYASARGQTEFQSLILDLTSSVRGLAAVHGMLSEKNWQPLDLSEFSRRIIQGALQSLPPNKRISVDITPSPMRIQPDQAHHLAFLLNELATNTRKHALPVQDDIHISVIITSTENSVVLLYGDNGPGYPEKALAAKCAGAGGSIGLELIAGIVRHNLGGTVRFYSDGGAITEIVFKIRS